MTRIKKPIQDGAKRLNLIGKIAIGEKDPQRGFPKSLDYFKFRPSIDPENAVKHLNKMFGDKPKTLSIVFPSSNLSEVCPQFYILRDGAGKRVATTDGETFTVTATNKEGKVYDKIIKPEEWAKKYASADEVMSALLEQTQASASEKMRPQIRWREQLSLRFLVLNCGYFGLWELNTYGAESSIPGIIAAIDQVIALSGGRLAGIVFELSVRKVKSDKAGDSKNYPVLQIVPNISPEAMEKLQGLPAGFQGLLTEQRLSQIEAPQIILLEAPKV